MKKIFLTMLIAFTSMIYTSAYNHVDNIDSLNRVNTVCVGMPSTIKMHEGDTFKISIRALYPEMEERIRYNINDSILNIWFDDISPNIENINSKDIRIYLVIPNKNTEIRATSNLLVTSKENKKKELANYEND